MGGELTVDSIPNQGSTFIVRLYLANLGAELEKTQQEAITGYQERKQNILVVDDQMEHRLLIRNILEPLGFHLEEAVTGADCLSKVNGIHPDLILLDLSMPEMNGFETAQHLRQKGYTLPIIVLTSNAYPSDRVNAVNAGCNDFLAKPLQMTKLLSKLKTQLGLTWIYQEIDMVVPVNKQIAHKPIPTKHSQLPPPEMLDTINSYVRIGDLSGLNGYLNEVEDSNPKSQDFIQQLLLLSSEFRLGELRKMLTITTEKLNDYDQSIS